MQEERDETSPFQYLPLADKETAGALNCLEQNACMASQ